LTLLGHLISNSFDQFEEFFSVGPGELKKFARHVLQTFHSRIGIDLIGTRVLKEIIAAIMALSSGSLSILPSRGKKPRPSRLGTNLPHPPECRLWVKSG
jgi:hypothetical protein